MESSLNGFEVKNLNITITLPQTIDGINEVDANEIKWISVWCDLIPISFGEWQREKDNNKYCPEH